MTCDDHKSLVRQLFEEVFPAGDPAGVDDIVAPDVVDHDPMPGQPSGVEGIRFVTTTLHTAYPDLRFSVDDIVAEADLVSVRWTMRGTNTGPMLDQAPTNQSIAQSAIVMFRIADGKIVERWAAFRPPERLG